MADHTPDTIVDCGQWTVTLVLNVWPGDVEESTDEAPINYIQAAKLAVARIEEWAASGYLERAVYMVEADSIPTMRMAIDLEAVQS